MAKDQAFFGIDTPWPDVAERRRLQRHVLRHLWLHSTVYSAGPRRLERGGPRLSDLRQVDNHPLRRVHLHPTSAMAC